MSEPRLNVGGQAVIEGVMMRSPRCFTVVVRRKQGEIVVREQPWRSTWQHRVAKLPFVRGALTLVESMQNGYEALSFSAQQNLHVTDPETGEVIEDPQAEDTSGKGTRLATVIAVLLLMGLPQLITWAVGHFAGPGFNPTNPLYHVVTNVFKLGIVLGYLLMLRRVPEIQRVFQYHGAEHKAIATYEAGEALTVENAIKHTRRHARCGTTFLIMVVLVGAIVNMLVLPPILAHFPAGAATQVAMFALRLLLLVPIAGLTFELQRLGARFSTNPVVRVMLTPGFLVQGITTMEPDADQLEIALASLQVTLARESATAMQVTEAQDRVFADFGEFALAYPYTPVTYRG